MPDLERHVKETTDKNTCLSGRLHLRKLQLLNIWPTELCLITEALLK
jgi:hypothetical protein